MHVVMCFSHSRVDAKASLYVTTILPGSQGKRICTVFQTRQLYQPSCDRGPLPSSHCAAKQKEGYIARARVLLAIPRHMRGRKRIAEKKKKKRGQAGRGCSFMEILVGWCSSRLTSRTCVFETMPAVCCIASASFAPCLACEVCMVGSRTPKRRMGYVMYHNGILAEIADCA